MDINLVEGMDGTETAGAILRAIDAPLEGYGVAIAYMDISDRVRDEENICALLTEKEARISEAEDHT